MFNSQKINNNPNPILVDFREAWEYPDRRGSLTLPGLARAWADYLKSGTFRKDLTGNATPEQVAHARKVLARLAALA